jgi:hypothetical protein
MGYCTERFTRLDYGQFLVSSQINYSITHFALHAKKWSHDTINRYLKAEKITPRLVWEKVQGQIVPSERGYLLFDDTVLDKNHARQIQTVRRQWSGNAKRVIRGIGVVNCLYVNPALDQFWIIDYRIYAPDEDGKTKLDHVSEMLTNAHHQKRLPFAAVLMDTWYAAMPLMKQIERAGKHYYCPVKANRKVSEAGQPYQRVDELVWDQAEQLCGKAVHLSKFPKGHQVKLFRLAFATERTDYVVTNDLAQSSASDTRVVCAVRWKIEQLHREAKQVTGIERCQCRSGRIQRNHIGCAMLVWVRLKEVAEETKQSIYQVKFGQLSEYLIQQLKAPTVQFA